MASQQVKFHSVTAAGYASATTSDGGLYFIEDNGEIRKGSQHVTGTRVFTATDSTGTSPVESLDIKFYDTSIGTVTSTTENDTTTYTFTAASGVEQPKRGDMLVVSHTLATGKVEYSAYIYQTNGGIYAASGWQACDGNVDASKVILTENYTLAGNYTSVGNLAKGTTYNAAGQSVADALRTIFTKELDDSTITNPSMSLTGSNVYREIGSTYASQTYTGKWNDGSYGYKAYWNAGDLRDATGAAVGTWNISAYNGKTNTDATISGNTAEITTDQIVVSSTSATTLVSFSVSNDLSNIKYAATNLGNESSTRVISSTSAGSATRTITGYQKIFYGSNTAANVKDYTSTDGSGNATAQVNNNIRSLSSKRSDSNPSEGLTSISVVQDAIQVVIAVPSNKTLTKVLDGGALNAEITDNFILTTLNVGGADSTAESIGSHATSYKVYVMTASATLDARTYTITLS